MYRAIPIFNKPRARNVAGGPGSRFNSRSGALSAVGVLALAPAAWFRFNLGITVTGAGVSQWSDQSGNNRHLLQATDAARPPLQGDGTILFDGTAQFLKCSTFVIIQPETVYLLVKSVSWTATDFISDGNVLNTGAILQDKTGGSGVSPAVTQFAGAYGGNDLTHATIGAYHVVGAVFNGASSGVFVDGNDMQTGNAGAGNMGGFTLGCRADSTLFGNIQVKEAIVFPVAHDSLTRAKVVDYLTRTVGLA